MFKVSARYRLPVSVSIGLHIVIIIAFFIHLPVAKFRAPAAGAVVQKEVVQAVAVESNAVTRQVADIKRREAEAKAQQEETLRSIKEQAEALSRERVQAQQAKLKLQQEQQRLAAANRLAKLRAEKLAKANELAKKRELAAAERKQVRLAKRQKEQQMLAKKQQELAEKMLAQQMASENKALSNVQTQQMQGIINRYKAQILSAIGQRWVIPPGINNKLSSQFLIHLAPGGVVLSVQLLKSSGNHALDRSAEVAIYKASPLPVPQDPAAFNQFRELRLTVRPEVVLNATATS